MSDLPDILDPNLFAISFNAVRKVEPTEIPDLPLGLDVIHMDNEAIEELVDSVIRAEETGELRRMTYSPCFPRSTHDPDQPTP